MNRTRSDSAADVLGIEDRVASLLSEMTLAEKIGQMSQINVGDSYIHDYLADAIRAGGIGSVLNEVDVSIVNEMQRMAVEESRLKIPLLVGRDVIHGFKTVMPIPFGQAMSWNHDVVRAGARVAAREAARCGVNWTFAPMIDVARDPRWGRIAESFGEDPYLAAELGLAMVEGFQGDDLASNASIAACAKHFAGYGAAESGRDYATTNVPENEMRNVYLRPFRTAVEGGVCSLMTSFSDIDGIPATANAFLLRTVLRDEWNFDGLVVSDWDSIRQLCIHGLTENDEAAAFEAATAGVDMEMHGDAYARFLEGLVEQGRVDARLIDLAAANILRIKFRLGLFDNPYTDPSALPEPGNADALATAKAAALESAVLLQNEHHALPLDASTLTSLAVIGPLADAPRDQLGTWIFDGDASLSVTPLRALSEALGDSVALNYVRALPTSRSRDTAGFDEAVQQASLADAVVLFLGEEAILSGEAHSRADIDLPGAQPELVRRVREAGKPTIAVIMSGRPLTLSNIVDQVDAILFLGHPGTMGGPAIADLLLGAASPVGKLPASMPRMVGQVPIYYAQKNTGKPPAAETTVLIDEIDPNADQLSTGMTAYHLDAGYEPLFPFGHGLSYALFIYENIGISQNELRSGETLTISADLINASDRRAVEVAQLYIRDLFGSVTRPVKELKGFKRVELEPGERRRIDFEIGADDLAFYGRDNTFKAEPGEFHAFIGGVSTAELMTAFRLLA